MTNATPHLYQIQERRRDNGEVARWYQRNSVGMSPTDIIDEWNREMPPETRDTKVFVYEWHDWDSEKFIVAAQ